MPKLEVTSTREQELVPAVLATLIYPKLADRQKRDACRADLARVYDTFAAILREQRGLRPDQAPRNRDSLLEDRLVRLLRDSGREYELVVPATLYLVNAVSGASDQVGLGHAYRAVASLRRYPDKRGAAPGNVRRVWEARGPAGPLALAREIVQSWPGGIPFSMLRVAAYATWIADVIEAAYSRHLNKKKRPVVAENFFWRLPPDLQRGVEVTLGDCRGVVEAMLAGDHERLWRTRFST